MNENPMSDPFHSGEVRLQQQTGERDRAILSGRLISDAIPPAAHPFIGQQAYVVVAWLAPDGRLWSELVVSAPGFAASSADGSRLALEVPRRRDVAANFSILHQIAPGHHVGLLFIELASRRRLRVNGIVGERLGDALWICVAEAYPNCPKYIQRRELVSATDEKPAPHPVPSAEGTVLEESLARLIRDADTFFVASAHPNGLVDCSHRGGRPGFITVEANTLHIPDYPGNSMFGTLGNLALCPRAGLTFIDFDNQRQLRLTGNATLDIEGTAHVGETGGTGRWWSFTAAYWTASSLPTSLAWRLVDRSPFNP
jgi:uncharacterized protein